MPSHPTPPPGYEWRPARAGDSAALVDLLTAMDATEGLEEVLGLEGAGYQLAYPGLDPARDTLLAFTPDGAARAIVWVLGQPADDPVRARVWMEAHPGHLHLEPFLLAWAEACARPRLTGQGPSGPAHLRQHIEEHRLRRRRVLEQAGYRHVRTFAEMQRALEPPFPGFSPLPAGLQIVPWSPALEEQARLAANEAFALHWGALPVPPEMWHQRVTASPDFRPDLSRLVARDGQVLSLCLVGIDAEQNARRGVAEMWLERIGTIPAYHRRGLATTLVGEVLRAGLAAGLTRAALGVDLENTTGATALYQRLGFAVTRRTLAYVKEPA
ncbi:MAG: family N-acetyltransferase [Acidobacteria bacterium]|nr:family N-acetyltransferase [Acidobacteriota bacterium]